jgi:hypothetical protein
MGLSNLPPGCSSADGGIDHEYEQAVERLCDVADTPELLGVLTLLATVLEAQFKSAYEDGFRAGGEAATVAFDAAMEKAIGK